MSRSSCTAFATSLKLLRWLDATRARSGFTQPASTSNWRRLLTFKTSPSFVPRANINKMCCQQFVWLKSWPLKIKRLSSRLNQKRRNELKRKRLNLKLFHKDQFKANLSPSLMLRKTIYLQMNRFAFVRSQLEMNKRKWLWTRIWKLKRYSLSQERQYFPVRTIHW